MYWGARMMGVFWLPMSPENTIFRVSPASVSHSSTQAEPSRWPASMNRARMPSDMSISCPYSTDTTWRRARSTSTRVYSGSTGGLPARRPFWFS